MSRKRKAPKKIPIVDPKYKSVIIPKLINSIMLDGKKTIAEKIVYDAIDKIKSKSKEEPIEISEDKVMGTKFTMSVQTIVALVAIISSGVGGYYMLLQEIEEAKNLPEPPSIESIFGDEYPSKPDGHNWPRSYEQYKQQVGGLQEDMDAVYETLDEYEEQIADLEKIVGNLRVEVARKKDK